MTVEEFKQQMTASLEDFLSGTAKDALVAALKNTILPALREVATPFADKLKADAVNEQGWNKFRDGVFLPTVISLAFWGIDKLLDNMASNETPTEIPEEATAPTA
ncbi:MAG: prevent-host-death protein [Selenomonas bovis]|nr:prevent-host-death protein [Selenomonas bovis]